jgi:hypothetical protein
MTSCRGFLGMEYFVYLPCKPVLCRCDTIAILEALLFACADSELLGVH